MGFIKFEVPNSLPTDEAVKRVQALLDYWNRTYGVKSAWTGDGATMNGKAMGVTIDGRLQVLAEKILAEATDPGMLLRGQAKKYLTKKFTEYLDPAKTLEELLKIAD